MEICFDLISFDFFRSAERYGKGGRAYKRDAENTRGVRGYIRSSLQATSKVLQAGKCCSISNAPVPELCFFFSRFPQPIDLSPGDLLYYGGVEWLNISDFLGKIKKGLELHAMCFVFKSAVVFLCKERLRQKKKLMVTLKNKRQTTLF